MITDRPLPGTPAPAVIRAAAVLRAIAAADGNSRSVSELAEEVDAPRSSVINVLAALVAEGLVLGRLADSSSGRRSWVWRRPT